MAKFDINDDGCELFQLSIGDYIVSVRNTDVEGFADCKVINVDEFGVRRVVMDLSGDMDSSDQEIAGIIARVLFAAEPDTFMKAMSNQVSVLSRDDAAELKEFFERTMSKMNVGDSALDAQAIGNWNRCGLIVNKL